MAHLTLRGVSDDGSRLLLVDADGTEHCVEIDRRLRRTVSATGPAAPRPGPRETTMDSALRPRDIQARIRSGETPEAVAEAAGTSVEKIMPFAAPVLAEREHVAQRAQRSTVRRRPSDGATEPGQGGRLLGEAVEARLRGGNVDPDHVEWDSWRREDGRWSLVADFHTTPRAGSARFTFDMPGNYVTLDNDDARWLVGESITAPRDDLQHARTRRLAARGEEELPLGDDAIELVSEPPPGDPAPPDLAGTEPGPVDSAPAPETPATRRPVSKRRGRASVPSWDEIMFGGDDGNRSS